MEDHFGAAEEHSTAAEVHPGYCEFLEMLIGSQLPGDCWWRGVGVLLSLFI
jgi:hypothetical protein